VHIFITGGKGYVGARLAAHFLQHHNVTVASRNNAPFADNLVNVQQVDAENDDLSIYLKNVDIVLHLAALDAPTCAANPIEASNVNITGTIKWLDAAKKAGVKKFIYFSTVHVYGNQIDKIITEETCALNTHPYASTHKAAEDFVLYYHSTQLETLVLRMSNAVGFPVGEMQQWHLLIPDLCKMAVTNQKITIQSNPNMQRNFIAMQTVCNVVEHFIKKNVPAISTHIYNVCSAENFTLKQMANMVAEQYEILTNKNLPISYLAKEENVNAPKYSNQKLIDSGFNSFASLADEIKLLLEELLKK
jgi:UDP-glucose 4-epimerase